MAHYLRHASDAADDAGLTPDTTITVLSTCRDALCRGVGPELESLRHPAFDGSGLGGLPAIGDSGWYAALTHAPLADQLRMAVFVFTHIAVQADGSAGLVPDVPGAAGRPCCGALRKAHLSNLGDRTRSGVANQNEHDAEFARLEALLASATSTDITDFTVESTHLINDAVWSQLERADPDRDVDLAVFAAVQIHQMGNGEMALPVASRIRHAT